MEFAGLLLQRLEDLAEGFLLGRDEFGHEQASEDAVLLRHVALHAQAAALLAADDDGFALHERSDVFESDGGLVEFHAKQLSDGVHLMARGHGADDRAGPATVFLQVVERERENLVRGEPHAALVHNAEAVGIAIQAEAELRLAREDELADFFHAVRVRLGVVAAEERVQLVVEGRDLRAAVLGEERVEVAAPGAIHQLDGDLELRVPDDVEVDELANLLKVVGLRVNGLAGERADDGGLEGPAGGLALRDVRLDLLRHLRRGRRAVVSGELEALILRRVVAGGHVDAADGLADADGVRDDGRGGVALAKEAGETVGGKHLGDGEAELASEEAGVVTDDDDGLSSGEF